MILALICLDDAEDLRERLWGRYGLKLGWLVGFNPTLNHAPDSLNSQPHLMCPGRMEPHPGLRIAFPKSMPFFPPPRWCGLDGRWWRQ